jgi:UDP-GlcNAc:undecaprenyl-phosphate GlcNAc-1-phosphate transferase
VDDVFKDRLPFQLKLLGQILGVLVLMGPQLGDLVTHGGESGRWLYQLFFLGWYLTIVNSFNFSDNMNGLMSGLSVIAFGASVVYLGSEGSLRSLVIAVVLAGALLGFLPYNFPRSRVFLGDAGSMFAGFWMAWIQFDLSRGFGGVPEGDLGVSNLIPAILIMGVPLYDAAFVVFMRIVDRRPIYLGDNHHLSHRLVRGGFTPVEGRGHPVGHRHPAGGRGRAGRLRAAVLPLPAAGRLGGHDDRRHARGHALRAARAGRRRVLGVSAAPRPGSRP